MKFGSVVGGDGLDRAMQPPDQEVQPPLRRRQKTKRFRERYRKRVVVEHRIARLVQLGVRQARYLGSKKVSFQVALTATVANLGLLLPFRPL